MKVADQKFNDKETLLEVLYQFESGQITNAMAKISQPIVDEYDDIEDADDKIADELLKIYDVFEIKYHDGYFFFYGYKGPDRILLQELEM
jgi:hypothetical protein